MVSATGDWPFLVDVRRDSWRDGPGVRDVVFFKGCPLRCDFCQNPETQDPRPEIAFSRAKCRNCGRCRDACDAGAIDPAWPRRLDRRRCRRCGACAAACPSGALRGIGQRRAPEDLARYLLRDLPFFGGGGGVTLSGGEPTCAPDYVEALLRALKAGGAHVILETCGHFEFDVFARQIRPWLDAVFFDLKPIDPAAHRRCTGSDNALIHENLRRLLADRALETLPRAPMIPGLADTEENLRGLARLLRELGAPRVELLPYNPLGLDMYEALGRPRPNYPNSFPTPAEFAALCERFTKMSRH